MAQSSDLVIVEGEVQDGWMNKRSVSTSEGLFVFLGKAKHGSTRRTEGFMELVPHCTEG